MPSQKGHSRNRLSVVRTSPEPAPAPTESAEVVLGGKRYRLVPVSGAAVEPPRESGAERLTPRELQVVALVADGRVNKQIADELRISEFTVSTHLRRIFAKLGVDTRAAMVARCAEAFHAARWDGA